MTNEESKYALHSASDLVPIPCHLTEHTCTMSFRLNSIDHLNRAHAIPLFMRMTCILLTTLQYMLRLQSCSSSFLYAARSAHM